MTNAKPRLALAFGILCISIFPYWLKLSLLLVNFSILQDGIAVSLLLPYVLITKNFNYQKKYLILAILCGSYSLRMLQLEYSHSGIECWLPY
jgi:hypothetical protein